MLLCIRLNNMNRKIIRLSMVLILATNLGLLCYMYNKSEQPKSNVKKMENFPKDTIPVKKSDNRYNVKTKEFMHISTANTFTRIPVKPNKNHQSTKHVDHRNFEQTRIPYTRIPETVKERYDISVQSSGKESAIDINHEENHDMATETYDTRNKTNTNNSNNDNIRLASNINRSEITKGGADMTVVSKPSFISLDLSKLPTAKTFSVSNRSNAENRDKEVRNEIGIVEETIKNSVTQKSDFTNSSINDNIKKLIQSVNEMDIPKFENDITEFVVGNPDVDFNRSELDKHLKKYEALFKSFPNFQNATQYLIYFCGDTKNCGGLADRIKGMAMTYVLSVLTGRRFAIHMTYPCNLEKFLQPNILNWSLPSDIIKQMNKSKPLDYFLDYAAYGLLYERNNPDPVNLIKDKIAVIRSNQDFTRIYRKLSVTSTRFPQLYAYHSSDLLRIIYHGLFKPTAAVQRIVTEFFDKEVGDKKLACLHARMGETDFKRYNMSQIMIPLKYLKKYDARENYRILVATDNDEVKSTAKYMFKHFVDTSGPILHIDDGSLREMSVETKCSGFMRSVVDHIILQRCDDLILTASGFGVTAGSIRHTSHGLHVYIRGNVVIPTKRELLREDFQWRCIGKSFGFTQKDYYGNICDS